MDADVICRLLKKDADAEIFEDVLGTLMIPLKPSDGEEPENNEAIIFAWLSGLSQIDRFDMLMRFVATELRERVYDWLVNFQQQCSGHNEAMMDSVAATLLCFKK